MMNVVHENDDDDDVGDDDDDDDDDNDDDADGDENEVTNDKRDKHEGENDMSDPRKASADILRRDQRSLADRQKAGYYVRDGVLYRNYKYLGQEYASS